MTNACPGTTNTLINYFEIGQVNIAQENLLLNASKYVPGERADLDHLTARSKYVVVPLLREPGWLVGMVSHDGVSKPFNGADQALDNRDASIII